MDDLVDDLNISRPFGRLSRRLNYKSSTKSSGLILLSLIILQTKRMDIPELPRRLYTSGEEPEAHNSISYHTDNSKLHTALRKALTDDEFEELKESSLGVFIKFKEQGFGWASRLVHYMLSFKLDIKKKYEMWSLVGPEPLRFSLLEFENLTGLNCEYIEDLETPKCDVTPEMVSFWGMLGVHLEAGPTTDQIIAALKRCGDWSREDRKRLAYLSIFTGFIEGRKFSTATRSTLARLVMDLERFENYPWGRVAFKVLMDSLWNKEIAGCYTVDGFIQVLQVWTYTAMPELGASIGGPRADSPSPPILAYEGSRGRRSMKAAILSQVFTSIQKTAQTTYYKSSGRSSSLTTYRTTYNKSSGKSSQLDDLSDDLIKSSGKSSIWTTY